MMTGSEYDHALLLTNFFASIGKKSFLVLGQVRNNQKLLTEKLTKGGPITAKATITLQ
jgi:hypothetical protein